MLVEHRAIAEDVRSRNADEASLDEHVKAMTGGGQHPVINRPVLIPDFLDGEALDLGANRRTSARGREAGLQGQLGKGPESALLRRSQFLRCRP